MASLDPLSISGFVAALAAAHATVVVCIAGLGARLVGARPPRDPRKTVHVSTGSPVGVPRADRSLGPFALLNIAVLVLDCAVASAASAITSSHGGSSIDGPVSLALVLCVAEAGRAWAIAALLHFILVYTRTPRTRALLGLLYAAPAAITGLLATRRFDAFDDAAIVETRIFGHVVPCVRIPPTLLGGLLAIAIAGAATAALMLLVVAQRRGRKEAIAITGMSVLALALAYDGVRHAGLAVGPPAAPFAYAFLVNSLIVTLLARFTDLRAQLEDRAGELRDKARDLTDAYAELRAAQDALVRKEQLAAVGELSAVVAHEVRNPLAIIANAVASLRRKGISDGDRDTLLGILDEETTRLNHLVGDLLRYTRPINPERHLVSIRDLVTRGMALTQGKIGLDVDVIEPEPTPKIWGDPNLLRQVFDNLIDNAIQAMSSGGVLTVTLVNLTQDDAEGVEVQIHDTGEGMDTDVRARALDPFFTTRPSGTGLGLAIVARIVDAHGGTVRIRSKAGAGTAMHVFLPISAEGPARSRASDASRRSDPLLPPDLDRSISGGR